MPHRTSPRLAAVAAVLGLCLAGCGTTPPPAPSFPAAPVSPTPSAMPTPDPTATPSPTRTTARPRPAGPREDDRTGRELASPYTVDGVPVVSKRHPINADFRRSSVIGPHGLTRETQAGLSRLIAAAKADGVRLVVRSGYRSYQLQAQILAAKIREYGNEALARRYNAAPGRSEHQTGLAVDLWDGVTWGVGMRNTRAGRWLWANAWKYGFVLRYPNGKEAITGYAFEPWHYRWIGTAHSRRFGANSRTSLEEYLGIGKR